MSHSNHHQLAGYLRDTRNVSGYLRDTRNVSGYLRRNNARYIVAPTEVNFETMYSVIDREGGEEGDDQVIIASYYEQENADAVAKQLNAEDDTFGKTFDFLESVVTSDIGQAFIADKVGVTLKGKDAVVAASKSGELEALKKELAEKEAKRKKTTRNLMIGGGVLAAGGLAYLAMRRR
jgi:hypothetical protein